MCMINLLSDFCIHSTLHSAWCLKYFRPIVEKLKEASGLNLQFGYFMYSSTSIFLTLLAFPVPKHLGVSKDELVTFLSITFSKSLLFSFLTHVSFHLGTNCLSFLYLLTWVSNSYCLYSPSH